ncbi:MAG TPA: amylo-alpha-1,6-glucosidase [Tepidisphaeraceae bacterium]|jgi:predicted glycogen debranching enzyme
MKPSDGAVRDIDALLQQEWLATNHLGGYACSTAAGLNTRKYHGLLVAAMAPPVWRLVVLSRVEETVRVKGWPCDLACSEYPGTIHPEGHRCLRNFSAEPFPRWIYGGEDWSLQKTVQLLSGQNTVVITYTLLDAPEAVEFELCPLFALRPIHELMYQWNGRLEAEEKGRNHHRIPPTQRTPESFFAHDGAFEAKGNWYYNTIYRCEQERGYAALEDLWSPGVVKWRMAPGQTVRFVCSESPIELEKAALAADRQATEQAHRSVPVGDRVLSTLSAAAEQFVVNLDEDGERRSLPMITQYPWSPPSARDALIAMPGILLATGRFEKARTLLESLARRVHRGLIPTHYPEDGAEPTCDGADTSLWFIYALWKYIQYSRDESAGVRRLLDAALGIIDEYRAGTLLGICTDSDGLLASRQRGCGTSWMDAKAGDWVITPRCGRPVELNALWYNALCSCAALCERFGDHRHAHELSEIAERVRVAFNRRFWNEEQGCCYDVVEDHGPDPAVRPNQLLAISLPFAVLAPERHASVLERVKRDLVTPVGLRTLSPEDSSYQGRYCGDVVCRDRAYHQGTVYPWLMGPWISANLRVLGRSDAVRAGALQSLRPLLDYMRSLGSGQLCELFDGDSPHRPGGAIASATAVGELLRVYVEDIVDAGQKGTGKPTLEATVNVDVPVKGRKR